MTSNQDIAKNLNLIADLLEIQGVQFKPYAYRQAAITVEGLTEPIEDIYKAGKLEDLPGIGKHIAEKIQQLIKTGRLDYLDKLKKEVPIDVESLTNIEGLGPKKIALLYKTLKIKNVTDLKKAAEQQKIQKQIISTLKNLDLIEDDIEIPLEVVAMKKGKKKISKKDDVVYQTDESINEKNLEKRRKRFLILFSVLMSIWLSLLIISLFSKSGEFKSVINFYLFFIGIMIAALSILKKSHPYYCKITHDSISSDQSMFDTSRPTILLTEIKSFFIKDQHGVSWFYFKTKNEKNDTPHTYNSYDYSIYIPYEYKEKVKQMLLDKKIHYEMTPTTVPIPHIADDLGQKLLKGTMPLHVRILPQFLLKRKSLFQKKFLFFIRILLGLVILYAVIHYLLLT